LETYIVRIYRREPGAACELAGMVEEPGCPETIPFVDIDELLNIFRKGSSVRQKEKRKDALENRKEGSK